MIHRWWFNINSQPDLWPGLCWIWPLRLGLLRQVVDNVNSIPHSTQIILIKISMKLTCRTTKRPYQPIQSGAQAGGTLRWGTILSSILWPGFENKSVPLGSKPFMAFMQNFCPEKENYFYHFHIHLKFCVYFEFLLTYKTSTQRDLLDSLPLSMVVLSAIYTGGSKIL